MANTNLNNRDFIINELKKELMGPDPRGDMVQIPKGAFNINPNERYSLQRQNNGEEIIKNGFRTLTPTRRYGVGILYPLSNKNKYEEKKENDPDITGEMKIGDGVNENYSDDFVSESVSQLKDKRSTTSLTAEDDIDEALLDYDPYKPSTMGISFVIKKDDINNLNIIITGGHYYDKTVHYDPKKSPNTWWIRENVIVEANHKIESNDYYRDLFNNEIIHSENTSDLNLRIHVRVREYLKNSDLNLVTVTLINSTIPDSRIDRSCLFQSKFDVKVENEHKISSIVEYPEQSDFVDLNKDDRKIEMLYSNFKQYGIGHGCAVSWDTNNNILTADAFPIVEVPNINYEVDNINLSINKFIDLSKNDGFTQLELLKNNYDIWINDINNIEVKPKYKHIQKSNVIECNELLERFAQGLELIKNDNTIKKAFEFANLAILLQQISSNRNKTNLIWSEKDCAFVPDSDIENIDYNNLPDQNCWRAFQIAFIVMSIPSLINPLDKYRENVDLIWFPTGGGKTEAYLGLSAFSIFYRRLIDNNDTSTNIIMRYTLRLLTAQQFQRASSLICAMEFIRTKICKSDKLGSKQFSIGIWLGGSFTPNRNKLAVSIMKKLQKAEKYAQNLFLLTKCPWCGCHMGPIPKKRNNYGTQNYSPGYGHDNRVTFLFCPNKKCHFTFRNKLPIYVTDEDIYDRSPDIVIGTIDKFAMLAFQSKIRSIFGIGENGLRKYSPPGLIIQDELHLISGPLGSMSGLYEVLIEDLCTDKRNNKAIKPKIIASTATIKSYEVQIKNLFARENTKIFPPPGISSEDNYFSQYSIDKNTGQLFNPKKYVGIYAPGLGSLQSIQVRVISSLISSPAELEDQEKDPWWTLMCYFNSFKDLGTSLTLIESDIPTYLKELYLRKQNFKKQRNYNYWKVRELTGRLLDSQIPERLNELSLSFDPNSLGKAIDLCLATNIIEVGVDVDRLSLMTVIGQPITTSQYIQVSGRIGRKWYGDKGQPGLVVMIYNYKSSRDLSYFEKFKQYHQKIYSQVEPTSLTPFSLPVLDKALHAIMVGYILQNTEIKKIESCFYNPEKLNEIFNILKSRIDLIDKNEKNTLIEIFTKRKNQWENRQPEKWIAKNNDEDPPLLSYSGEFIKPEWENRVWPTPSSMRSVDSSAEVYIQYPNGENDG